MLPAVAGFKFKEGENFNHRNTLSILRIALKLHFVQNVEPDTEIGQKGAFCKGLTFYLISLCKVCLLQNLQYLLNSNLSGVVRLFFVVV